MNHKWNYQPITPEQAETSQTLAQELGISPILGQLLVQRGITKAGRCQEVFPPAIARPARSVPDEGHGHCSRTSEQGDGKERAYSDLWRL